MGGRGSRSPRSNLYRRVCHTGSQIGESQTDEQQREDYATNKELLTRAEFRGGKKTSVAIKVNNGLMDGKLAPEKTEVIQ